MDKKQMLVSPDSIAHTHPPTEVDLTGADLYWVWSSSVSEIPTRIEIDRLCAALSKTLSVYRTACGRIRKNSASDWKVFLTDSPLPVEVVECNDLPQFNDSVWQPHAPIGSLVPNMPSAPHEVINADLPLVSLKVSLAVDKTMLGISWHHAIGDDATRFRFMSLLSRYYQGLDPLYPLPSFARHHFFSTASENAKLQDDFAFIRELGGAPEIDMAHMAQMCAPTNAAVRWTVPRAKVNILRRNVQQSLGSEVSIQDCLTAYVASAVHQCGYNIRRVNCSVAFRGLFGKPDVAGNLVLMGSTAEFEDSDACDPCQVALKIRQAITVLRQPERVAEIMRNNEQFVLTSTEKGDWNPMLAAFVIPNTLTVNGMASLTWQESVNFGYVGAKYYAAYHSELPFYVRIHPANPNAERSAADSLEVIFSVPESMHSKVLKKLGKESYQLIYSPNST